MKELTHARARKILLEVLAIATPTESTAPNAAKPNAKERLAMIRAIARRVLR